MLVGSGQVYGAPDELPVTRGRAAAAGQPLRGVEGRVRPAGRPVRGGARAEGRPPAPLQPCRPGPVGRVRARARWRARSPQAEADGAAEALLRTGDVSSARDFTDVRDVVSAYVLAAGVEPGAYNVCSGRCVSVPELIEALASESTVPVRHEVDPARLRPNDAAEMRGTLRALRRRHRMAAAHPPGRHRARHTRLVAHPAELSCPACGGALGQWIEVPAGEPSDGRRYPLTRCATCGTAVTGGEPPGPAAYEEGVYRPRPPRARRAVRALQRLTVGQPARALGRAGMPSGARVLDAGAGTGRLVEELRRRGHRRPRDRAVAAERGDRRAGGASGAAPSDRGALRGEP